MSWSKILYFWAIHSFNVQSSLQRTVHVLKADFLPFWAQMALVSLGAITGPNEVSISRAHPFQSLL